jgi:hypothetical protein
MALTSDLPCTIYLSITTPFAYPTLECAGVALSMLHPVNRTGLPASLLSWSPHRLEPYHPNQNLQNADFFFSALMPIYGFNLYM